MERTAIFWARLHCRLTERWQTKNWVVGRGIEHAAFFFPLCCRHIKAVGKKILFVTFCSFKFFFCRWTATVQWHAGPFGGQSCVYIHMWACWAVRVGMCDVPNRNAANAVITKLLFFYWKSKKISILWYINIAWPFHARIEAGSHPSSFSALTL